MYRAKIVDSARFMLIELIFIEQIFIEYITFFFLNYIIF